VAATRDPSQKITFVYQNLYRLYQDGKKAAHAADPAPSTPGLTTPVIKAGAAPQVPHAPKVNEYSPLGLIGKRVVKPAVVRQAEESRILAQSRAERRAQDTLADLKQNLGTLQGLQSKIKFFLTELEDLNAAASSRGGSSFSFDQDE
jgi:hypothetical protein